MKQSFPTYIPVHPDVHDRHVPKRDRPRAFAEGDRVQVTTNYLRSEPSSPVVGAYGTVWPDGNKAGYIRVRLEGFPTPGGWLFTPDELRHV